MRSTRGLLLVAILVILAGVGGTYYLQKKTQIRQAPAPPPALPVGVNAAARDWQYARNIGSRPGVEVRAKNFRQLHEPDRTELEGVELLLYQNDGRRFDRVRSAHAIFDPAQATLYSDGEVEITMGERAEGTPGRLVFIHTSGVTFESKTGKASTDRAASFTFDQGEGKAVGASYDPSTRELHMRSGVELAWRGRGPKSRPMKLEAGELVYKEADSVVLLFPWSRLTRENAVLEAADAIVTLEDGAIRTVEAKQARGADRDPGRQLEYGADQLGMTFSPNGELEKITGEGNARVVSTSEAARTTVTTSHVDLEFEAGREESTLKKALATGSSVLESAPVPRSGAATPESRILRSDVVFMEMRPGGREIEQIQTHSPGQLEFVPNRPGQRHRTLDAERMWITYGAANHIQSFRAVNAATRTDPDPARRAPQGQRPPPVETWSKDLSAEFDAQTGQLARLEQWNEFRYQEGERKARAARASLDEGRDQITLETAARVWDSGGSTAADRIVLDQKSGDMAAQGSVVSTRLPDRKGGSSAMLSNEENLEAKADRMLTTDRNQKVRYEGSVVTWQGANRIQADRLEIDRRARRLLAEGNVVSRFLEKRKDQPKSGGPKAPPFVTVQAPRLAYTEENRMAHYTGGARLVREDMEVKASQIRAFLKEANADSSLDRAYADGQVEILHTEPGRTRKGTGEHAEYHVAEEKIVLRGGEPALVDSLRGYTRGQELTYFARDDRLLVYGLDTHPVKSRIRRN